VKIIKTAKFLKIQEAKCDDQYPSYRSRSDDKGQGSFLDVPENESEDAIIKRWKKKRGKQIPEELPTGSN
jgi:hypothetical protein